VAKRRDKQGEQQRAAQRHAPTTMDQGASRL